MTHDPVDAVPASRSEPATSSEPTTNAGNGPAPDPKPSTGEDGTSAPARRRRSRGGRGRGRGGGGGGGGRPAPTERDAGAESGDESTATPRTPAKRTMEPRASRAPRDRDSGDSGEAREPRPPRAPRSRQPRPPSPTTSEEADDRGSELEASPASSAGTTTSAARRRRRRGGRGRRRPSTAGQLQPESAEAASEAGLPTPSIESAQRDDALPDESPDGPAPARKRAPARRGRSSRTAAKPAGDGAGEDEDEAKSGSRPMSTRRMKAEPTRVRGRGTRRRRDIPRPVRRRTDKRMVITENDDRDQIAVLEGRELVEHYITRAGARSMVGNIYMGRVQNVLPGMEAAFIDIGRGRNGVLYAGEVNYDEEVEGGGKASRIEDALKTGQKVLVQVTKDPLGGKGARLTAQVSLPGRFLVFVPDQQVFGISRRLPDEERARLRDILKPIRPEGSGVIARTAAEGASAEDLEADLKRLEREWEEIAKRAKKAKPATVVYEEPELTVRVVRDVFTEGEFEEVVTDAPAVFEKVTVYLRDVAPELLEKVRLHEGPLPVMEEFHVAEQIRKALERKVWLESGGYIIIDRTEAMTVIDVNTGKHVGKSNLEETVTQTNIEAAEEIARQLRLRDIGGMIIIDFIDMLLEKNRGKVIRAVKSALAKDRTRSQVFDISPLGLLEVTRKKVSAGLVESFSETCPQCEGRGILLTHNI